MKSIEEAELREWLAAHPRWREADGAIKGAFKFNDFKQAFGFLTQIAMISEKQNHHALIENMYDRVTLTLTTHDAGNRITQRDLKFADAVERVLHG